MPARWAGVLLVAATQQHDRLRLRPEGTSAEHPFDHKLLARLEQARAVPAVNDRIQLNSSDSQHIVEGLRGIERQFKETLDAGSYFDTNGIAHFTIVGLIASKKYDSVQRMADQIIVGCLESEHSMTMLPYGDKMSEQLFASTV